MSKARLQVLIVEDDALFAVELQMLVEEIGYQVIDIVDNSAQALDLIFSNPPDLVLMDIDIKGRLSGVEIGQKIRHLNLPILYITSFDDSGVYNQARKSQMIGYLVKPLSKYSIQSAIRLAMQNLFSSRKPADDQQQEDNFVLDNYFFFKKRQIYQKVTLNEIALIEADGDYINVYTTDREKFVARMPISAIENQLPSQFFYRVHRSYIVNLNTISSINFKDNLLMIGGKSIPVSKSRKKELSDLITKID